MVLIFQDVENQCYVHSSLIKCNLLSFMTVHLEIQTTAISEQNTEHLTEPSSMEFLVDIWYSIFSTTTQAYKTARR
jgi:hypothetical protein